MTTATKATDKEQARMLAMLDEANRLEKLTNAELVAECNQYDAADLLIIQEMMNRLDPHWAEE